jgi:pimeloyl-ACP methyl ester carboxylesterase
VSGVNAHHRVGTGPRAVIVLHGWFTDRHGFAAIEDLLSHTEFSSVFMDCRGYGDLTESPGPFTFDQVAADVLALADALGFAQFSLIGHSMGAKAAQRVLTRAPERVQRLVAVTPVPASAVPFDDAGWSLFSGAADNPANRRAIIDFTTGNRLTATWLDRMVVQSLAHSSRDAFAAYLLEWARVDFSDQVKGLPHPVQVIVGEHDGAIGTAQMQASYLAWYPNARMDVMANAGHYPMEETPIALATAVEGFLRG